MSARGQMQKYTGAVGMEWPFSVVIINVELRLYLLMNGSSHPKDRHERRFDPSIYLHISSDINLDGLRNNCILASVRGSVLLHYLLK